MFAFSTEQVGQFGNWYANLLLCGTLIVMGYFDVRQRLFNWVPSHQPGLEQAAYGAGVACLQMAGLPLDIGHGGFFKAFVA